MKRRDFLQTASPKVQIHWKTVNAGNAIALKALVDDHQLIKNTGAEE
ncbi:hypothetical protein ACFL3A_09445 [Pseudomonadota bacterium]